MSELLHSGRSKKKSKGRSRYQKLRAAALSSDDDDDYERRPRIIIIHGEMDIDGGRNWLLSSPMIFGVTRRWRRSVVISGQCQFGADKSLYQKMEFAELCRYQNMNTAL